MFYEVDVRPPGHLKRPHGPGAKTDQFSDCKFALVQEMRKKELGEENELKKS